jgi:hypothetical protein
VEEAAASERGGGLQLAVALPERVQTDSLVGIPGFHDYGQIQVNTVLMLMTRPAAYDLGVLVGLVVASQLTELHVLLSHPASRLKELVLCQPAAAGRVHEFRPTALDLRKHPWSRPATADYPDDWPELELLSSKGGDVVPQERDVLVGFGTRAAAVRMASLFMSAAASGGVSDIALEHEPGIPGVRPGSCELIIAFPGSFRHDAVLGNGGQRAVP